jgi:hypothetical protein
MRHPDFRVNGKIFATLGYPDSNWGMVKLRPEQQGKFVQTDPGVFSPAKGAWGRRGYTSVYLKAAKVALLREAMALAWRNVERKRMMEQLGSRS